MLLSRGCRPCERVRLPGRMKIGIGPCGSVMPYLTGNSAWSLGMTSFGNRWWRIVRIHDGLGSVIARLSKANPLNFGEFSSFSSCSLFLSPLMVRTFPFRFTSISLASTPGISAFTMISFAVSENLRKASTPLHQ
jgi:hypothetical protein